MMRFYPFTGAGGIQITRGEHHRLEPGEFSIRIVAYNLTIRDRLWMENLRQTNPQLAEQIYIFSPFFYKKLKNKDFQAGYDAVRKWTSRVDIFTKRYLVVPINDSERVHWYLAIILYPENVLPQGVLRAENPQEYKAADEDIEMTDATVDQPERARDETKVPTPSSPLSSPPSTSADLQPLDADMNNVGAVEEELKEIGTPDSGVSPRELLDFASDSSEDVVDDSWKTFQDGTYLLIFDSLGGRHPSTPKILKQYLAYEAKNKLGVEIKASDYIQHKQVKSPVQPNYCDCGVYVIQTAQTFLENADAFFQRLMDKKDPLTEHHALWQVDKFGMKRKELFESISGLSEQWKQFKKAVDPALAETQSSDVILEVTDADKLVPKHHPQLSEDNSDSDVEIIGEVPAPKSPYKRRRAL
ncbi:hypothetical protein FRC17_004146 [Serendipita sp. 399]|nr:hypothetical protein FRC17_004146 [Serendipita sp. 399]